MNLSRAMLAAAMVCASLLLPVQTHAQRLRLAHPYDPVAFTFPAVRYDGEARHHLWRARIVKRIRATRHVHQRKSRRVHVTTSHRLHTNAYAALTGWRPLPYEFGPYNAAVVVLRP